GPDLMMLVEQEHPQVVFLDVEMPGLTGVECARLIQDMDPSTVLIFATAHDQYMGDAFEVYAFDYLIKPFKVDRVLKTLVKARDRISGLNEKPMPAIKPANKAAAGRLMLHHREGVTFLNMEDIVLVQRENRTTVIYTLGEGRFETGDSLADMEARLDPQVFFRCHKSYIINLNQIDNITPYGRWTYVVRLNGTQQDALITHEKYEELERLFA
ncbi:MAG: response regulator transcription factor, partial [Clostridia bacterium]|nr:response regulator transcription factor [Clostridia bacterium]